MRSRGLFIIAIVLLAASACGQTTATTAAPTTTTPSTTSVATADAPVTEARSTSTTADPDDAAVESDTDVIDGLEVLYIGHSFGRPFARNLETTAELAGVEGHEQHIIFQGGENGAPQAMWEAPEQQALIEERLDTGTVDVVIMICCSQEFRETLDSDQAIVEISQYALEQNPDTRIGLAMPWIDYPDAYPSVDEHRAATDAAWPLFRQLAEQIGDEVDAEVFAFYHGAAVYEVRDLVEQDRSDDVTMLIGPRDQAVFTDEKGHAGTLAQDVGTLVWLHAIYGIDPLDMPAFGDHDVDVGELASAALEHAEA